MKRAAIVIVLLGLVSGLVFGGGDGERRAIRRALEPAFDGILWLDSDPDTGVEAQQVGFSFEIRSGTTEVTVRFGESFYTGVYFLNSEWYYAFGANVPVGDAQLPNFGSQAGDAIPLIPRDDLPFPMQVDLLEGEATDLGGLRRAGNLDLGFRVPYDGSAEKYVTLYLINADRTYSRLTITIEHEFFPGENDLFRTDLVAAESYQDKALSLLRLAMEDAPAFDQVLGDLRGTVPNVFTDSQWETDESLRKKLEDAVMDLRIAIANHLSSAIETVQTGTEPDDRVNLPVLTVPGDVALTWYGASRNVYLSTYIAYVSWGVGKPVLERVMHHTLAAQGVNYDHREYQALSETEGESIAGAALRYLTWGVEYSLPDDGGGPEANGLSENLRYVFDDAMADEATRAWITGTGFAEPSYTTPSDVTDISSLDDMSTLEDNPYFQHVQSAGDAETTELQSRLTTPFPGARTGNPIAYSEHGIDTPRTFNYKLYEQFRIRAYGWAVGQRPAGPILPGGEMTTASVDGAPYVTPESPIESSLRPLTRLDDPAYANVEITSLPDRKEFVPGAALRPSQFAFQAGVGNLELLAGALSMASEQLAARVLDASDNSAIAGPFSAYASMTGPSPPNIVMAVDSSLRPRVMDTDEHETFLRMTSVTRADIERSSVVVPDISLVQPGDLLVRFRDREDIVRGADEMELAVVVGTGWESGGPVPVYGEDARLWWDKVFVVTASPTLEAVILGSWGDSDNVLAAFTQNPEGFHVRRLLRYAEADPQDPGEGDGAAIRWDLADASVDSLRPEITWATDEYATAHGRPGVEQNWIPNTLDVDGEYEVLEASDIRVAGVTLDGREISVNRDRYGGDLVPVSFIPPEDRHAADGTDADGSNIYENQGAGLDIVVRDSYDDWHTICRFVRQGSEYRMSDTPPEPEWHQTDGDVSRLYVWRDQLVFLRNPSDPETRLTAFGVRVHDDGGPVRPGDDFLLRLEHRQGWWLVIEGTALPEDFVAVYDKKMLWRANLYVNERVDSTDTVSDWNDQHSWDHPDNDWHPLEGEQLSLNDWTYFNTNGDVASVVPYNLGGQDSPATYNGKMLDQQAILNFLYTQNPPTIPGTSTQIEGGWNTTRAPFSGYGGAGTVDWHNYEDSDTLANPGHTDTEVGGTYPYRPGTALHNYFDDPTPSVADDGEPDQQWTWTVSAQSAGVDCVGLIVRSSSYEGSPYLWQNDRDNTWDRIGPGTRTHPVSDDVLVGSDWSRRIEASDSQETLTDADGVPVLDEFGVPIRYYQQLGLVAPGDVINVHYNSGLRHVAMVHSVRDENENGRVDVAEVRLIEATWGGSRAWAQVVIADPQTGEPRTLNRFASNDDVSDWEIVRLRAAQ